MKREHREVNAAKLTAKAPGTLALEAARLRIAAAIAAKTKPAPPQKVQAIPTTPGAKREDNSPYRKESRQ